MTWKRYSIITRNVQHMVYEDDFSEDGVMDAAEEEEVEEVEDDDMDIDSGDPEEDDEM